MRIKINREQPFQVLATNFSIGPSQSGYDLQISADGVNFTTLFSVGANVTRMVTGVANGSTYRLAGNTDEDVIVNWFRQCDDGGSGGGSGAQGPEGPQGYQGPAGQDGATGAQGPQGEAAQGGGDAHTLLAVSDLNDNSLDNAEAGDVRSKYVQHSETVSTGGTVDSEGETFPSDGTLAVKYVGEFDSIDGLRWKNGPDVWEMNESNDGLVATLISGDGSRTAAEVTATTTGTISGGDFMMEYKDGSDTTILAFENLGKYWACYSYSDSMQDYIFIYVPFEAQWLGEAINTYKTAEGVWQYVEGAHSIGKFTTYNTAVNDEMAIGFSYWGDFSSNFTFLEAKYVYGSDNKRLVIETDGIIRVYDAEDNLISEIWKGQIGDVTFTLAKHMYVFNDLDNGFVGLEKGSYVSFVNTYTSVDGSGWVRVHKNEPYPWRRGVDVSFVTVMANKEGQVYRVRTIEEKGVKINSTSTTTYFMTYGSGNLPNNMYAPTTGGTAGQILVSAGDNSAPTWSDWIKAVKITSDAYEALVVKDPNTLYLIVDE